MISRSSGAEADVLLEPFDQVRFGRHHLAVLPTPGHTEGQSPPIFVVLDLSWENLELHVFNRQNGTSEDTC